jgi:hypothetical protein
MAVFASLSAYTRRMFGSCDQLARAVDDVVQLRRDARTLGHPAREGVGRRIEQTISGLVPPIVASSCHCWVDVRDRLDVDDALPIHRHDGVVGQRVGEWRVHVEPELPMLRFALVGHGSMRPFTRPGSRSLRGTRDPKAMPTGNVSTCEFRMPHTSV